MTCVSKPSFNPLHRSNGCLISLPAIFIRTNISYPYISRPSKPIKLHPSCASSSLPSPVSRKKRTHSSTIVAFVARTSDGAQLGEDSTVVFEKEEEEPELSGGSQEVDDTEARVSDWESDGIAEAVGDAGAGESGSEEGFAEGEESYMEPPEKFKVYVGNMPYDVDCNALAQLFQQAGVVEIAEVICKRNSDQSRGFGFVSMSTVEEAEKAVELFNGYDLNGKVLVVSKAAPRGSRQERPPRVFEPAFEAYVGNLPWVVDNQQLEQVFSEHGKVVQARVLYDRVSGRSRGFGFVTMATKEELNDAVANLDGQSLGERTIRVNIAEDRWRRAARLSSS